MQSGEEEPLRGHAARDAWFPHHDADLCRVNHGSYGAAPAEVHRAAAAHRAAWQRNPDVFFEQEHPALMRAAREAVGALVGADVGRIALVDNATTAAACVAWSLSARWSSGEWAKGDAVLLASHTYDSVEHAFRAYCEPAGATIERVELPFPVASDADVTRAYEAALASAAARGVRVRVAVVDHIVSSTSVVVPVRDVVALARGAGVEFVFVDGAHAPGQVDLHLDKDFGGLVNAYAGNLHKWAFCPTGSAFLWAASEESLKSSLHHVVPSHDSGKGFVAESDFTGTRDYSALWAVPAGMAFAARAGGFERVRRDGHALVMPAAAMLASAWGTELGQPESMAACMVTVRLPAALCGDAADAAALRARLLTKHGIQVQYPRVTEAAAPGPGASSEDSSGGGPSDGGGDGVGGGVGTGSSGSGGGGGQKPALYLRISAAVYNEMADYERLRDAVLAEAADAAAAAAATAAAAQEG